LDAESLSDEKLEEIRSIAISESLLVNRLISPSGHVTGVNIDILLPGKSMEETKDVAEYARKLAGNIKKKYPAIDLYLTGDIIFDHVSGEISLDDMTTLTPLMFLTLLIIIGLTLRSFMGTLTAFVVISISTVTGIGLAGWLARYIDYCRIG